MDRTAALLAHLSDGAWHSGQVLADALGLSRTAVWKQVRQLRRQGVELEADPGTGYRIANAFVPLDGAAIVAALDAPTAARLRDAVDVVQEVDSTNSVLMRTVMEQPGPRALLAEQQTRGRGRRGRAWQAGFGASLCLSLHWPLTQPAAGLSGLSLAVGIAVADALQEMHGISPRLKWPNDILVDGRKLGGVLIEMAGDPLGPCEVVIGIGLNVQLPAALRASIDQPVIDLVQCGVESVDRNRLAAAILGSVNGTLELFEREGFAAFQAAWRALDALHGYPVDLLLDTQRQTGVARGVDAHGRLLVDHEDRRRAWASGDVSIRVAGS